MPPQALHPGPLFCDFGLLSPGPCLRPLPPPVQGSHMWGPLKKHIPGLDNAWECSHAPVYPPGLPLGLAKTRALVTCVLCLFCLHQIFRDHFILLSTKFWQLFDSTTKGHQTTGFAPFLGRDSVHNFVLLGSWAISAEGHVKCNASHASKKEGDRYFGRAVRIAVRISDPDK